MLNCPMAGSQGPGLSGLKMDTATKNAIYAHAEKEYPGECCGLLIDAGGSIIYKPMMCVYDNTHRTLRGMTTAQTGGAG